MKRVYLIPCDLIDVHKEEEKICSECNKKIYVTIKTQKVFHELFLKGLRAYLMCNSCVDEKIKEIKTDIFKAAPVEIETPSGVKIIRLEEKKGVKNG